MADRRLIDVLQRILSAGRDQAGVGDAELLRRYTSAGDQAAFELLIWRYQRMLLGVCWRVLQDLHDAEEAFQATFLILARKARSVGRTGSVGGWLHRVATRVSLAARKARARRTERERPLTDQAADGSDSVATLESQELGRVVDEEVSRLPERFREAVVLCYFEGRTVDEAALRLGCPRGTVASRLARARARLEVRLTRRGLALSSGALAAGLSAGGSAGAASGELVRRTGQVAASGGAVISTRIVALSEEVIRAMLMRKMLSGTAVLVVSVMMLGGGLAMGWHQASADRAAVADAPTQQLEAKKPDDKKPEDKKPEDKKLLVTVTRPVKRDVVPFKDFEGTARLINEGNEGRESVKPIFIGFNIDEESYLAYKRQLKAGTIKRDETSLAVGLCDETDFPHQAKLSRFGTHFSPKGQKNPAKIDVLCEVSNDDEMILPGMSAKVRMKIGPARPVLQVLAIAVHGQNEHPYVWIVDEHNMVSVREVQKGALDGKWMTIEHGLRPEDLVIVVIPRRLREGECVETKIIVPKIDEKKSP